MNNFVFFCSFYYMNQIKRSITENITAWILLIHSSTLYFVQQQNDQFKDYSAIDMIDPIHFNWNVAPEDNPICMGFVFNWPLSSETFLTLSPMTDDLLNLNGSGDNYFCCNRHKPLMAQKL